MISRLALVALCALGLIVAAPRIASADPHTAPPPDPQQGSYSLALVANPSDVASGGSFVLQAVIERGDNPPYQAVQWKFRYDPAFVQVGGEIQRTAGAPDECFSMSNSGNEVALGCIDVSGPFIEHSGATFDVPMTCVADGAIEFVLDEGGSFVYGADTTEVESHKHSAVVNCGAGGPTVVVPTATTDPDMPPPQPVPTGPSDQTPIPVTPGQLTPQPGDGTPAAESTPGEGADATATAAAGGEAGTPSPTPEADGEGDDGDGGSSPWLWIAIIAVALTAAGAGAFYFLRRRGAA